LALTVLVVRPRAVKNIWISVLLIAIANTLLYNYFDSGVILGAHLI
jgi:hypothetical protein